VKRILSALFVVCALFAPPVHAAAAPDYLTFGGGAYDFDKYNNSRRSVDFRAEYQWGASLLPMLSHRFNSIDSFLQIHPVVGLEGNSNDAIYPNGGLNFDLGLGSHAVVTWGEAVGFFGRGDDPRSLGSIVEFRSQLELGWRFNNDVRVSGFISHISNAHLVSVNPGAEIAGGYVRIPLWWGGKK
jgi:hypothetical protein